MSTELGPDAPGSETLCLAAARIRSMVCTHVDDGYERNAKS